jgi:hypothetical protein
MRNPLKPLKKIKATYDKDMRKVSGVVYADKTGTLHEQKARVVCVKSDRAREIFECGAFAAPDSAERPWSAEPY